MGSGVTEVDTYPHRLEVLLNVFRPQEVHEVLNLGLAGTNLSQSLGRLRHIGLRFAPDLIVYGWTHNDLEGAAYRRTRPAVPNPPSALLLVRWAGARWSSLRDLFRPGSDSYVYELDENYFRNTDAWAAFTGDLDRLAGITRDAGTCGVVFLHTALYSLHGLHPFSRYYRRVEEAARRRGLHVVESFEHFRGRAAAPLWVAPLDPHPNADGHRILARALFDGLEALPASCLRRAR